MAANEIRTIIPVYAGADKVSFTASCGALPVKWLSFSVALVTGPNKSVAVRWQTANEINAARFTVERSSNGRDFLTIGNIAANNTSNTNSDQFTDINQVAGMLHDRLPQMDKDSKNSYSSVAIVNYKTVNNFSVSPNPIVGNSIVFAHGMAKPGASIRIISGEGKTVVVINVSAASTITRFLLNILATGVYQAVLQNGTERSATMFIKQ